MKHILCFGDSNTFGTDPVHGGRHPESVRWTGVLQSLLGDSYGIIEEGCGGRTTVFEDEISPGRNGLAYLSPCISSHNPLDLIIVMLGTNDLKNRFHLTPSDLERAMGRIIDEIQKFPFAPAYPVPEILIVSPIHIKAGVSNGGYDSFTEDSVPLSHVFSARYKEVSRQKGCHFFDAATVAEASDEDRLHMNAEQHKRLAVALAQQVQSIL